MVKYSYQQMLGIIDVIINCAQERISNRQAEQKILTIHSGYPVHNLKQEKRKANDYLSGKGWYGYSYPAGWAKAFIEVTNNDSLVIKALREQQKLYLEKDGSFNNKLEEILNNL